MCLCETSPVYIYMPKEPFLDNLLGSGLTRYWGEKLGLVEPIISSQYGYFCGCQSGGYFQSMFALGVAFLIGVAIAFAVGFMLPHRKKLAAIMVLVWLTIIAGTMYADYARVVKSAPEFLVALYVRSAPIQFIFDTVMALILPAFIGYWIARCSKRISAWRRPSAL